MYKLFVSLILLSSSFCTLAQAQLSFNCKLINLIVEDFAKQKDKINAIHNLKDIFLLEKPNGDVVIVNNSNYPKSYADSIIIALDSLRILDDSIFYFDNKLLFIDTFYCFNSCNSRISSVKYKIRNQILSNKKQSKYSVIEVIGYSVVKNYLVIALRGNKSKNYIQYYFSIERGIIKLIKKQLVS